MASSLAQLLNDFHEIDVCEKVPPRKISDQLDIIFNPWRGRHRLFKTLSVGVARKVEMAEAEKAEKSGSS